MCIMMCVFQLENLTSLLFYLIYNYFTNILLGSGPIWLDQVNCLGNESFIQDCHHWHWGEHNCEHTEDAAVVCSKSEDSCK